MKSLHLLGAWMLASLAGCAQIPWHTPESDAELRSAVAAAHEARIDGPAQVRIAGRTVLQLQIGLVYIPPAAGERLLRAIGERPLKEILGLVISSVPDSTEIAVLYARNERIPGIPDLEIAGWNAAPALAGFRQR